MSQNPTYEYNELKVLVPTATLQEIKEITKTIRDEKELYSINDYSYALLAVSDRLIILSKEL
jgi:hypothetical protein